MFTPCTLRRDLSGITVSSGSRQSRSGAFGGLLSGGSGDGILREANAHAPVRQLAWRRVKLKLIPIAFIAVVSQPALPQQANEPLTKRPVVDFVKYRKGGAGLAKRIQECSIDFEPTDDDLAALGKAGAPEAVLQAMWEARKKPLSREQVGKRVAEGVPGERAAALVKRHSIDFQADEEHLEALREDGADEVLLAALREAATQVKAGSAVIASPHAGVNPDRGPQGNPNAQSAPGAKAKSDVHALKGVQRGREDYGQNVILRASQPAKVEARLEDTLPVAGPVRENHKDGLKYVWILLGSFTMGCPPSDSECLPPRKASSPGDPHEGLLDWTDRRDSGGIQAFRRVMGQTNALCPLLQQ